MHSELIEDEAKQEVAALLREKRQDIIDSWLGAVRQHVDAAKHKHRCQVRDHIPVLLDQLISQVELCGSQQLQAPQASSAHGAQRVLIEDYDIQDILEEYHLLRDIITRYIWVSCPHRLGVMMIISSVIDKAIEESVNRYEELTTELRLRERNLIEKNARKDEFIALVSHELRNPLSAILWASQLLEEWEGDEAARRHAFLVIKRQSEAMVGLVDDLLDVSTIVRGTLHLKKEEVDVKGCIVKVVETLLTKAEKKHISLRYTYCDDHLLVFADPLRLQQVIGNIVSNAIKFSDEHRTVEIKAASQQGKVLITIHDSGSGMDAAELKRVFDPFYSADMTLARSNGGLGLGLYLARKLTESMGGTIAVQSAGKGQGSEFTVTLPLLVASTVGVLGARKKPERRSRSRPKRRLELKGKAVLIVEDRIDVADMMALKFENYGCFVEVAYEGRSGLSKASTRAWDAVLIDLGLPIIDGYQLVHELRKIPLLEKTLFIALSGYGQAEDLQYSKDKGFAAHLVKPVDMALLKRLILKHHATPLPPPEPSPLMTSSGPLP